MTQFRSQTDERLAVRWDDAPYVHIKTGERALNVPEQGMEGAELWRDAPRAECIPSRDPAPWHDPEVDMRQSPGDDLASNVVWSPRPEFARPPVNRVLEEFREFKGIAPMWLEWLDGGFVLDDSNEQDNLANLPPAEIDHARRVLTLLAALGGVTK